MTAPIKDRMDPRWAKTLIDFTLSTRAADVIPNEKIDTIQAGLQEGTVQVRLSDKEGKSRAKDVIGRRTAGLETEAETGTDIPTVFLQPRDRSRKSHVYACTGDIRPIFKDGLRYFRDHQPFLFAPSQLQKIHIKSASSEFVLETVGTARVWRITKPQKLATETAAIKNLIEKGLFSLRALRVFDRSQVTLPTVEKNNFVQISLLSLGQTEPVTLDIYPPENAQSTTVYATVSDRPNTVFELPLRPVPDLISLAELPLSNYNELRSQSLTSFDPKKLSAIHFTPAKSPEILLSRPPRGHWRYHIDEKNTTHLNELTLYQFLKTMTETKVAGFLSDSAFLTEDSADWETYGLKSPLLTMKFLFQDDSVLILQIGKTKDGVINVNMEDDAIRGLTVIKNGEITWPAPPLVVAPKPAPKPAAAPAAKKGHGHGEPSGPMPVGQLLIVSAVAAVLLVLVGAYAPAAFLSHFTVFVLACFVGYMVVWNVKPALHTPLMSVTNAISSIIAIGALVQISPLAAAGRPNTLIGILAALALVLTAINMFGGFAVTQRMLAMFRK